MSAVRVVPAPSAGQTLDRRFPPSGGPQAVLQASSAVPPFARVLIRILFGCTVLLSIALVKWSAAGLPIRSITAILLILVVALCRFEVIVATLRDSRTLIAIIIVCALLGTISSLLNSTDMGIVGQQLLEIHVQAIVGTLVGVAVARTCGSRTIVTTFAIAVGLSAAVAALQFLEVGAAWDARRVLGSWQLDDLLTQRTYSLRERAMGLSYTPVHLGTQLCLLFAAVFAGRLGSRGDGPKLTFDSGVLLALVPLAVAAIASGNRSPLLGMLGFTLLYLWVTRHRSAILLTALGVVLYLTILSLPEGLQGSGLRIANTDDGSAVGRTVLQAYGFLLFLARPFGYGLAFDSTEHWVGFWQYLKDFDNAYAITWHALHNYYLMMLNKYGIAILILGGWAVWQATRYGWSLLGFVPYLIHVYYHNDGPLQGDFLIWYIIPLYAGLARGPRRQRARPADPANARVERSA